MATPLAVVVLGWLGNGALKDAEQRYAALERAADANSAALLREIERHTTVAMAVANRRMWALEILSSEFLSGDEGRIALSLRLIGVLEPSLADELTEVVVATRPEDSEAHKAAVEVREAVAVRGYYFAVVASYEKLGEAVEFVQKWSPDDLDDPLEAHLSENGYYGVSLGGYLSYDEAARRVEYAVSRGIASDAYVWRSRYWGRNALR